MDRTLLILLTAHLLGDFILQNGWMVSRKRHLGVLALHVLVVTAVTAALLGSLPPFVLGTIFLTHFAMDGLKIRVMSGPRWRPIAAFSLDQAVHLAVLVAIAGIAPTLAGEGLWMHLLANHPEGLRAFYIGLTFVSAVVLTVPVGGHLIGMLTADLLKQIEQSKIVASGDSHSPRGAAPLEPEIDGLRNGGRYIGWIERGFVLLLMLINQPEGVGFLIAAKSLFRVGDIRDDRRPRLTEYVIIGTFLSFGWAMLVSVITIEVIAHWQATLP